MATDRQPTPPEPDARRRSLVTTVTQGVVGGGLALACWPFIAQMNPNPGTTASETVTVDLGPIGPGQTLVVRWRDRPVHVRHRTVDEISRAATMLPANLPDPYARNAALQPLAAASDANRTLAGHERWLVVIAICPHLGCVLPPPHAGAATAPQVGWHCPCHAARFDHSGRVIGGPARTNLAIPPLAFLSDTRLRIG